MSDWLEGLPSGWSVANPRHHFRERREPSRPEDVHLTPSQHHGVLSQADYMAKTGTKVVLNLSAPDNMKRVRPGDFIAHLRSFQGGLEKSDLAGKVSTAYTVIEPFSSVEPRFYRWVLKSPAYIQVLASTLEQLRDGQSIKFGDFAAIRLPMPPLEEQRRIADFLDDRVARIEQIITAREGQVLLLAEERRSVAEHLSWEGLSNSDPRTRAIEPALPSPDRWLRLPNRYLLREATSLSKLGSEELLTVSHLTGVSPRSEKSVNMFMAESLVGYKLVHRDDLVINTLWAWMGALAISPLDGIVSPAYGVYRPIDRENFHPGYYDELYRSSAYICEMTRHSKGVWSSRLRLYPDSFLSLIAVCPPMEEQTAIHREIQLTVGRNISKIAAMEASIELLHEYKQSLITAAVTGEIDVTTAGSGVQG